jgi:hypothetical protein
MGLLDQLVRVAGWSTLAARNFHPPIPITNGSLGIRGDGPLGRQTKTDFQALGWAQARKKPQIAVRGV